MGCGWRYSLFFFFFFHGAAVGPLALEMRHAEGKNPIKLNKKIKEYGCGAILAGGGLCMATLEAKKFTFHQAEMVLLMKIKKKKVKAATAGEDIVHI